MTELERIQCCTRCPLFACAEDAPLLRSQCPIVIAEKQERRNYIATPAGRAAQQRANATPEAKERRARYNASRKGKQRQAAYAQSFKGRVAQLKARLRKAGL